MNVNILEVKYLADEVMFEVGSRHIGQSLKPSSIEAISREVREGFDDLAMNGVIPEGYLRFEAKLDLHDCNSIRFCVCRRWSKYPMTEQEYKSFVGVWPLNDDLHRVNCSTEGTPGHVWCGWDIERSMPNYLLGCTVVPDDFREGY